MTPDTLFTIGAVVMLVVAIAFAGMTVPMIDRHRLWLDLSMVVGLILFFGGLLYGGSL